MQIIFENIISLLALGAACLAAYFTHRSTKIAESANQTTKTIANKSAELSLNMFKRQSVVDLHLAWRGVNEVDPKNLVTPDIINALNALDLTSSIWNHDIMDKDILIQSYWRDFRDLYDTLNGCNELVPGKKSTCRALLLENPAIATAYESMKQAVTSLTVTSKFGE